MPSHRFSLEIFSKSIFQSSHRCDTLVYHVMHQFAKEIRLH